MSLRELWGLIRVRAVRCEDFQRGSKVNFCDKHAWADFKSRCIRADEQAPPHHILVLPRAFRFLLSIVCPLKDVVSGATDGKLDP